MTDTSLPGEQIDMPVPPNLSTVLGYRGDARFVGVRYTCLGDQVVFEDGQSSGTGQTWSFLAFKRHRAIDPFLRDADLGSSEEDGTEMLLIDTQERKASIAPLHDARVFLDGQWPEQEPMTPEQEEVFRAELERLLAEQGTRPIDWDAISRQQREQSTRMAVMLAFLDQQVPPSQGPTP
jgi:hypothetical protein